MDLSSQTWDLFDAVRLFLLTFLEILLSADNIVVLALLASTLAPHLRSRALYIGTLSACLLRALALFFIATLIRYPWLQLLGGAYLLYLSLRFFAKKKKRESPSIAPHHFWTTVALIELFDLAFAVDSILAGIAFIDANLSKIWVVYVGGILGLIAIRYAAHLCTYWMERFPKFEISAYGMIGWIGTKLSLSALFTLPFSIEPIFWAGMILLFLLGFRAKNSKNA